MRPGWSALLFTTAFTIGCGSDLTEPEDECAHPRACQVGGVDRVVAPPVILVEANHPHDPDTGFPIFMPGEPVTYEVMVYNRGDTRAVATTLGTLGGDIAMPPLDPGSAFRDTVEVVPDVDWFFFQRDTMRLMAYLEYPAPGEDPLFANDEAHSAPFIVALPVLGATIEAPDTVVAGVPFTARVTVRNLSRFAGLEPSAMALCLWDFGGECGSNTVTEMPAIPAGGSWTADIQLALRQYGFPGGHDWNVTSCIASPGASIEDFSYSGTSTCVGSGYTTIHVRDPDQQQGGS